MQTSSVNLGMALTGGLVTWGKPLVYADWAQDGYGAVGSIDDLSDQIGRPLEITHYLDDGLPNEVTFAAGLGTPDLNVSLTGGGRGRFTIRDIFNRVSASGLGTSTTGQLWSNIIAVDPTQISVNGNVGLHTHSSASVELINMMTGVTLTDVDATLTVGVSDNSSYADSSLYIRCTDSTHFYRVVYLFASGTYSVQRANGGGASTLQGGVAGPAATTGPIKIRIRMAGSTIQTMVWLASATPPTDFQTTITDTQLTQGGVGLGSFDTTTAKTFSFTDLSVTDLTVDDGDVVLTAAQYYSPFRVESPVYSYDRDVAPLKVDAQTVTSAGLEAIRVFTGRMISTPVEGRTASVRAVSANRIKLAKIVQLPLRQSVFRSAPNYFGLTAAWAVTWAMHQCAVYPSPPAVSGARLWVPLHGGGNPYLPYSARSRRAGYVGTSRLPSDTALTARAPVTIEGPYVGAMSGLADSTELRLPRLFISAPGGITQTGFDWLSKAGMAGRFESYIRADTTSLNSVPGGSGQISTIGGPQFNGGGATAFPMLSGFSWYNDTSPVVWVTAGIRATDRRPVISVNDGTVISSGAASALPSDGLWHYHGYGWDIAAKKMWINIDGTVTAINASSASSANLPSTIVWGEGTEIEGWSAIPVAEWAMSAGPTSNHDNYPTWMYNMSWTRSATVYPSILDLEVTNEQPREAWELIGRYAQAELAHFRADENDQVIYYPITYWAKTAAQTTVATLSAWRDSKPPNINLDPSKIRNSVRLTYNQSLADQNPTVVWSTRTALVVPPGTTYYLVALTVPVSYLTFGFEINEGTSEFYVLSTAQINGTDLSPAGDNYISFNTSADGSGTILEPDANHQLTQVIGQIWDYTSTTLLLRFDNLSATTYYVANSPAAGVDYAYMSVSGYAIAIGSEAFVTAVETDSVTERGERGLPIQIDAIQTADAAQQIANILVGDLAYPQPVIEQLELFGDPRRQPGDLVSYSDPDNSGMSGLWRLRGIKHVINAASYTQITTMRRARTVGTWDSGLWNDCIWGE